MDKLSLHGGPNNRGIKDGLCVLSSFAQMQQYADVWRDLDVRTTADFVWFQSYEWCANWILHHGEPDFSPRVFMLIEGGKVVAVLPLMQQRTKFGLRLLKILGDPHTQYANILTETGTLDPVHAQLLQKAIMAEQGVDQVLFQLVPGGSALAELVNSAVSLPQLDNSASQLDLRQFANPEAFEEGIGKKTSRNLRRATNHFEKLGALRLDVLRPGDAEFSILVDKCLKMKASWLINTGRVSSGLTYQNHDRFLSSVQGLGHNGDGPMVFALMMDDTAIAIEIGFLQQGHYYAYMGAFDWNLRNYSPGKLQMHFSIKWLIAHGAKTLDLLGNPADYKQHYASFETSLTGFALAPTLRGKILTRAWTGFARPKAKQIFLKFPKHWRTSFIVLRKLEYNFIA